MNLPNKLTMLRIFLIPLFIACFYIQVKWNMLAAAAIFIIAYITDFLDGYIARKHNLVTDFGKLMDPIADKLLTAAAQVFLLAFNGFLPIWGEIFVFSTIAREFLISGMRLVAASRGNVVAAGFLGKAKTFMQFITLTVVMLDGFVFSSELKAYVDCALIGVTVVLTLWSMTDYLVKNKEILKDK